MHQYVCAAPPALWTFFINFILKEATKNFFKFIHPWNYNQTQEVQTYTIFNAAWFDLFSSHNKHYLKAETQPDAVAKKF